MKKKSTQFDKFTKKKSNAAIKEEFRQEKRKFKKEREEYFDKKKAEARSQRSEVRGQKSDLVPQTLIPRPQTSDVMPLNKFIAHAGISGGKQLIW